LVATLNWAVRAAAAAVAFRLFRLQLLAALVGEQRVTQSAKSHPLRAVLHQAAQAAPWRLMCGMFTAAWAAAAAQAQRRQTAAQVAQVSNRAAVAAVAGLVWSGSPRALAARVALAWLS
jgi:hypothetical protein